MFWPPNLNEVVELLIWWVHSLERVGYFQFNTCFYYVSVLVGNLVGIGGGSQVYRGKLADGRLVAVKLLNQNRPQAEEELLTDIEINSSLKHRHIVALLGYCVDATHLILVYDFLAHGNLDDHLHSMLHLSHQLNVISFDLP